MARKYWELDPKLGAEVVKDEVLFARGWCWPTEGDAAAVLETSKFMVEGKMIPKPLEWSAQGAFALTAGAGGRSLREERAQAGHGGFHREGCEGPARLASLGDRQVARPQLKPRTSFRTSEAA